MDYMADLGYHNVGFHNPEQVSPNIDELSRHGVTLENHYTFKVYPMMLLLLVGLRPAAFACSADPSFGLCSSCMLLSAQTLPCCERPDSENGRLPVNVNQKNPSEADVVGGIDMRMTIISQKLKSAGYATDIIGTWHCGAVTVGNLPVNRGFDHHLGFLTGGEDHYTQKGYECLGSVDLWEDHGPAYGRNGTYSCNLYTEEAVNVIRGHDPAIPLFLYMPYHDTHAPYQVPDRFLNPKVTFNTRQIMEGMLTCVDEGTGNITAALKQASNMWNNTLM
eukprot:gene7264-1297_t